MKLVPPSLPRSSYVSSFFWFILHLVGFIIRIYHDVRLPESHHHHHHHHVPEELGMLSCSLILKMKLVPPSLPRSSYVSSSFWFILDEET